MKLAAAQFPVFAPHHWGDIEQRLSEWVSDAAQQGAQLLLFPEYSALCGTTLLSAAVQQDLAQQLSAIQTQRDDYLDLHRSLAQAHQVYLIAGSFPWQIEDGRYLNRAFLCAPDGRFDWQDKQIMTRFEREIWGISAIRKQPATGLKVFETALGVLAINICYDSEFPLLARAQCAAGAELLLVPSCTDTLAGYFRVRTGCQARALENQCLVVQSPLVGAAPWSAAIDCNIGAAGVFGPPDIGFPDDGVLALGKLNEAQWLFHEGQLSAVSRVRRAGQVLNFAHWDEQGEAPLPPVTRVQL